MEAEVDWWHGEVSSLAVHHSIVVTEGKRSGTAESVARNESDGREWEVHDRCQEWEEALGVRVRVLVGLIEL